LFAEGPECPATSGQARCAVMGAASLPEATLRC
jgi:hypothetical protein